MNSIPAQHLLDSYVSWIKDNTTIVKAGDAVEMVTPVLDRHNDFMSIYVASDLVGGYTISDLGATLADLDASGCSVLESEHRCKMLNQVIKGLGVSLCDGELYVKASIDTFALKKHLLLQAMSTVDDLFFTAKPNVRSLFTEDVEQWLIENSVRFSRSPMFTGSSGLPYSYEFVIPPSYGNTPMPERFIKTVNNPDDSKIKNLLFSWTDTQEMRDGDSRAYAFMNSDDKQVSGQLVEACRNYGIVPVVWPYDKESVISELAA